MTPLLTSLLQHVPPPESSRANDAAAWLDAEHKLNLTLPDDYKQLIDTYGDYRWSDFLYMLNPFSQNTYLNLHHRSAVILDAERQLRAAFPEHYPLPLYPEPGGLLPFCITDNGDTGFWITHTQPNTWPILLKDARAPECEIRFVRVSTFLYQFSTGSLKSLIFPSLSDDEA